MRDGVPFYGLRTMLPLARGLAAGGYRTDLQDRLTAKGLLEAMGRSAWTSAAGHGNVEHIVAHESFPGQPTCGQLLARGGNAGMRLITAEFIGPRVVLREDIQTSSKPLRDVLCVTLYACLTGGAGDPNLAETLVASGADYVICFAETANADASRAFHETLASEGNERSLGEAARIAAARMDIYLHEKGFELSSQHLDALRFLRAPGVEGDPCLWPPRHGDSQN
jgi:hypothetical protein